MVKIETTRRRQYAVLWAAGTTYTEIGRKKVQRAVQVEVRWEEKQTDAMNAHGESIRIDATVVVDQDVEIGSLMWLGELADWTSSSGDIYEVVSFSKVPNLKQTRLRRVVGLVRYSDSLPSIET